MLLAHGLGNAARDQNADEKQDDKADSGTSSSPDIVFDKGLEFGQTSLGIDLGLGLLFVHVNHSISAPIGDLTFAAFIGNLGCKIKNVIKVRKILISQAKLTEVDIFPILVVN